MRLMWIGGTHPRHLFYINSIHQHFKLVGAVVEAREGMIPVPPTGLGKHDRENFIRHFDSREQAELRYFKSPQLPDTETLVLKPGIDQLNSQKTVEFVRKINPDLVFIFGCGMIREPLYSALPKEKINLHLGLSPRYRGSATLFWPFYFLEPQYAGSTFHYIIDEPDAGNIIHQVVPKLDPSDGIHDVACKVVQQSSVEAVKLLEIYQSQGKWKIFKQKGTGKNFLSSDFKPEHLRIIYRTFNDDLVSRYLNGEISQKKPALSRQFN